MSEIDNSAGNPFAPPVAQVQDAAPVIGDLAGRGARFAAAMIDGIFFGIVLVVAMVSTSVGFRQLADDSSRGSTFWVVYGVVVLLVLALQSVLLWKRGQTVGKILMSIRIVRTDRTRASFVRLVGARLIPMWFVGLIPLIGPLLSLIDSLLIFRESRRCLHDDIADTVVIRV